MDAGLWIALLSGIAVAASCGLRAFLPLLALGLASRAGLIELRGSVEWLASDLALITLSVATVLEIAADKIPVVDHALDTVATVIRPAAGWLGSFAVLSGWSAPWAQIAALVLGTMALSVHTLKSTTRLGSTVTTGGAGNFLLSVLDDVVTVALLAIALFASVAVLVVIPIIVWLRARRRRPAVASTGGGPATPHSATP